ncbi:hypothetical protein PG996_013679 [Apiospora saccharicola]|uniref:Cytochrome P450 n=1 Tax=Apiospora saccharicola TaxID=335842 RepID=A0ABR1U8U2_9PEZI
MGFQTLLVVPLGFVVLCLFTFLKTNLLYQIDIWNKSLEKEPPTLPYSIPWLGHAFGFLTPVPGRFFSQMLSWYSKEHGGASMKLAGRNVRLIFSTTAVQALLRVRHDVANSDTMVKDMMSKGMKMGEADLATYFQNRHLEHEVNNKFLLRPHAADVLLGQFHRFMKHGLLEESIRLSTTPAATQTQTQTQMGEAVDLYKWVRTIMFKASAPSMFGERLLAEYPNIVREFWDFEYLFLDLVFGVPRWVASKPHVALEKVIEGLTAWIEANDADTMGGKEAAPGPDMLDQDWEPRWGSRLVRARQQLFQQLGLSPRGRASMELSMLFGLNSNAVPAIGWMLMHILDPRKPDLLPRIMQEIQEAVDVAADKDGEGELDLDFDLATLISQPLLQSIFQEVLRLYNDVLITRGVHQDLRLPTEDSQTTLLLKKGTIAMAPSYVNHHDPTGYCGAPVDEFDPERFLVPTGQANTTSDGNDICSNNDAFDDEKTSSSSTTANTKRASSQKPYAFSPGAAGEKMIPFGGGRTMCPGRVFAKREVFSALALVLLHFEITPLAGPTSYRIPGHVASYTGSGIIGHGGDVKVHIKKRQTSPSDKFRTGR